MNDNTLMFLICALIILFVIHRLSTRRGNYGGDVPLDPGTYRIGEDLDPGKCDIVAVSGVADICIMEKGNGVWIEPIKLAPDNPIAPPRYRNKTLQAHDILEINGKTKVLLTPPTAILDGEGAELTMGIYQFGVDIPPAKYDLKAIAGSGQFSFYPPEKEECTEYQDMAADDAAKTNTYKNLLCEEGSRLEVEGTIRLKLSKSVKQRGRFYKMMEFINQDP